MYTGWVKGRPNYSKYIPAYIGLINDGMDRNEAFIHAFGITPARMERETFRYLKLRNRGLITYPIDQFKYHGDITTKALTEEKASYELGYLLAPANPKAARELFEALLKKQPTNKRILSGLAVTYQMEGEWKTGLRFAADALDDEDYLTHLEYADMLVVYCASRDAPKNCDEQYQIALKHYNKVLQLEPKNMEGRFGVAKCLSNLNLALDEALEHVTAVYERMPYNSDLNYWRGHIHFQLEDYENAKIFLEKASTWSHNKKIHEKIKSDMLHINPGYAQAKH
jgi:tetratricopeptide (TPR) repeat protein